MSLPDYLNGVGQVAVRNLSGRTARRVDRKRARRRAAIEALESRLLLSASITISAANQLAFLGDPGNDVITVSFVANPSGGTYTINDLTAPINVISNNGSAVATAGSGTNTVTVTNLSSLGTASLSFDGNGNSGTGPGDTFSIQSANDPISINQTGPTAVDDTFNLGNTTDGVQSILAPVSLRDTSGAANVTIDDSADTAAKAFTLAGGSSVNTISNLAPGIITYAGGQISSLTINGGIGNDDFTVNFSGGNPIPSSSASGLIYSGGGGTDNVLNLVGTPPSGKFASVVPQATGTGSGSITFVDHNDITTSLTYADLTPITDTVPAVNYTFNDFGYPDQSFSATTGPIVDGDQTLQFTNTPTPPSPLNFETTEIANKSFVTFNTPAEVSGVAGPGIISTINVPVASTGLLSLTINASDGGNDIVSFVNTPAGVVTSLYEGAGADTTNVTGLGVAAGTVLFLNGGPGSNTLNFDAGGETPTVTPGLDPGEVLISIPGAGVVDAVNYSQINITDVSPLVITPGPAASINGVQGVPLVNAQVGTFTLPVPVLPPPGGFPASDFTASLNWGDGTSGAGTITQNADDPSVYSITATHTFAENGAYSVSNSVAFAGATYTTAVNGVPISTTFGSVGPTAGNNATAIVNPSALTGSTSNKITGVEGSSTGTTLLGTFIDGNQASTATDYTSGGGSVVVDWGDGSAPQTVSAANLTAIGSPNGVEWTINAAHTYVEDGTFAYTISVKNADGAATIVSGSAVVADAPLFAGPATELTANTGNALPSSTVVGTFTDNNTFATTSDFTDAVDWGDGSSQSTGVVVATATPGVFDIEAGHDYANPGEYSTYVTVHDEGGSQVVISGSATVTDLPVTGSTSNFTAIEGQITPMFVLAKFDDPNTLATLSDVNATLAVGGWGDGTPTVAGVQLLVQQTGVDPSNGDPTFEVLGSHTYAQETPPGLPDSLSVIITTLGGATTTLTSPPGGGVTVLDAPLTGSTGNKITGVEGNSTGTVLLGTFTDGNPDSTVADYTSGGGSVVVNWGDGSAPQTLTASNLTEIGSANGAEWTINAAHTYAQEGSYAYTVTVTDNGGSATISSGLAIVADAPLFAGSATDLSPNTGIALSNSTVVGTFTDASPLAPISDFTATIDWGDGSLQSTGVITQPGGVGTPFVIVAPHTFAKPGVYTTLITVHDEGGSPVVISGLATVTDLPVSGSTHNYSAIEGEPTPMFVLATFEDPNTLASVSDVSAKLAVGGWGDGTPTVANSPLVVQEIGVDSTTGDPMFEVLGSHSYAEESPAGTPDALSVIITTLGGASTTLTSPPGGGVTVLDAPLTGSTGSRITAISGSSTGTVLLGTFTDGNTNSTVADFTAGGGSVVVNWGDGSAPQTLAASNLTEIGSNNGVEWTINASHTYASAADYAYTITVTDAGGSATIVSGLAIVAAPPPPVNIVASPVVTPVDTILVGASTGTISLATFTDADAESVSHYTATITWSDGHTSAGTITFASGVFTVKGSHFYASSGDYSPKVSIQKDTQAPMSVTDTNRVDVLVTAHIASDSGVSLNGFNGRDVNPILASFTAAQTSNPASDYSATINWGDGTATVAGIVVSAGNGHFRIVGSHVYSDIATDTITITLKDTFGDTVIIHSTDQILDAPLLLPTGKNLTVTHGSTFTNLAIGSFVDEDAANTNPAEYVGTINWGDGTSTTAATFVNTGVTASLGSLWSVEGTHKYATAKTYNVTISIHDVDSPSDVIVINTTIKAT